MTSSSFVVFSLSVGAVGFARSEGRQQTFGMPLLGHWVSPLGLSGALTSFSYTRSLLCVPASNTWPHSRGGCNVRPHFRTWYSWTLGVSPSGPMPSPTGGHGRLPTFSSVRGAMRNRKGVLWAAPWGFGVLRHSHPPSGVVGTLRDPRPLGNGQFNLWALDVCGVVPSRFPIIGTFGLGTAGGNSPPLLYK